MLFNPNSTLESDTVEDAKSDKVEQSYQKTDKGWGKEQHQ